MIADPEEMVFKILRGLTFDEALEAIKHIDIADVKDDIQTLSERLDPILTKYGWSVEKMITYYIINKDKYEQQGD